MQMSTRMHIEQFKISFVHASDTLVRFQAHYMARGDPNVTTAGANIRFGSANWS